MAVYSYVRVSTEVQVTEGVSLDEQERRVLGRTMEMGWLVTETFVEKGVSGGIPFAERPAGGRLCKLLRKGDSVIAAKLDRIFRSARDALNVVADFQERGISLWLLDMGGDVSGNGLAKLFLTMAAGFAEFERDRIGERIRDAKRHQRDAGQYLGGEIRFGFRRSGDGKTIVEDPTEQRALATMRAWRTAGASFRDIAKAIQEQHGITVGKSTIQRALKEPQS